MEKRSARRTREIVIPGDVLGNADEYKAGENAYELDGKIRANVIGTKTYTNDAVGVTVMGGFYMPVTGDTVIGIINDVGPSNWMLDINAPYPAPLHVSEVPWKVEFGDTSRFLTVGDVVLLKILMVDESKKIQVTMKDSGLRKIEGGQLVEISYSKISRVIGKSGSMIQMLKNMTDCRIFVGQNGRIWIDGDGENVDVAAEAIRIIERESRSANLTDRVREFIEKRLPQSEEDEEEDSE
ncbi:MAG: RNA-binding protein [Candidatus Methanomethylophilus sp.]|nr:RNA-binding protein [Methanomethylophilus sp.]MBQ2485677.1 RNA-binding protein [Methanomethylophilus sp.]MBQ4369016.1 RNA-binding protein [Methanomethylophilus sp.]MBQ4411248.1 RNA-binding protein [Methanomethylophilus sp.]MBQ5397263.1 RNA-binding protein [Methanomethylophilus sp.]